MESDLVQISGCYELQGHSSRNSYLIGHSGRCKVLFKDTGQLITFQMPKVTFAGMVVLWGRSTLDITSSLILIDERNQIKSHVCFGTNSELNGLIYKYEPSKLIRDQMAFNKVK